MHVLRIQGIVPIIPTPFNGDGDVDCQALGGLIEFAYRSGACAVCLPAYASEFYKLSPSERDLVISTAISASANHIPVIAQVNAPSLRQAIEAAARAEEAGASAVNIAVPRLFPLSEDDIYRYFDAILERLRLTVVIQDFNPGGPTISPEFIARLHARHPHFAYVKLEEALMASKVAAILRATGGEVGVIEGWGGMYLLELVRAGICGVMPGLALSDLLAEAFRLASEGKDFEAYDIVQGVLPQIVYSLQNMEFFHHAEKTLLEARGVLPSAAVREATVAVGEIDRAHLDFLNARILDLLDRLGMPRNPSGSARLEEGVESRVANLAK